MEGADLVTSEQRGSATLERYMDPNNYEVSSINQGNAGFTTSWDSYQRFRIVQRKDFVP